MIKAACVFHAAPGDRSKKLRVRPMAGIPCWRRRSLSPSWSSRSCSSESLVLDRSDGNDSSSKREQDMNPKPWQCLQETRGVRAACLQGHLREVWTQMVRPQDSALGSCQESNQDALTHWIRRLGFCIVLNVDSNHNYRGQVVTWDATRLLLREWLPGCG